MSTYKHILFAADLAEESLDIAKRCVALAESFGAQLTLLHVIEPVPTYGYIDFVQLEQPAKDALLKLGKSLGLPEDHCRVEYGSVKGETLAVAEELGVDLMVVGAHSRHGVMKLLGSNASAIAHSAPCDVFILRYQDKG